MYTMKLELFSICKKATVIYSKRGFSTNTALRVRARPARIPLRLPYEPGIRHRRRVFQEDSDVTEDVEDEADINSEINPMNLDHAYDLNKSEKARAKNKLQKIITGKKFFSPKPQPQMLTCNERHCIRHLHKQDPVQWDVKTLSESFPATYDTIKKILKANWKITPERAKVIDSLVQKNWELLAEDKLEADPHVLTHMKKFINRREVLLEQIKNDKFYLPEIKREKVWNNGEFTNILVKYEKVFKRLAEEKKEELMLKSGVESGVENEGGGKKGALDVLHEKVNEAVSRIELENKDSFVYRGLSNFYSKEKTLEEMEDQVLKRADKKKRLNIFDKAILESKLGVTNETNSEKLTQTESFTPKKTELSWQSRSRRYETEQDTDKKTELSWQSRSRRYETEQETDKKTEPSLQSRSRRYETEEETDKKTEPSLQSRARRYETDQETDGKDEFIRDGNEKPYWMKIKEDDWSNSNSITPPDSRTLFAQETSLGKLLNSLQEKKTPEEPKTETYVAEDKPKIDHSDPERKRRENMYYDREVSDIESTQFWGNRSSTEKAMVEHEKRPLCEPGEDAGHLAVKTSLLSEDGYPERINIPKNKRRSGLTFKVKDCYYDDDGKFLYRVPGMCK